jgi:hypothetical protein
VSSPPLEQECKSRLDNVVKMRDNDFVAGGGRRPEEDTMEAPKTTANEKKVCPRCGETKSREHDFTHRSNGTVFSWCKECNKDYARERAAIKRAEREAAK